MMIRWVSEGQQIQMGKSAGIPSIFLYTGFVQTPGGDSKGLRFLPEICNADIHQTAFSAKT